MTLHTERFKPTRAGIVNLWDYRDQEFCFADGRLVLRGPNGSGKTKALEVLFPFVLDGRIEPRRLNPFAGEERTMKSNLLYRKQESAHSYVWMEFSRGDAADPEAVTVGIGMRATKSSDKVTRWYFVADGRVGVDFSLLGPDDRPLTRRQLADEIGGDAIVDRPVDYRAAIDARLFALGAQRYDQLITLILTLRRPQLAKNLDPRGLSQALADGLRPLDEQLVLDAARSFSDMEEVGRTLEGLVQADRAAASFVTVYTKYLAVQAKTDVEQVARRLGAVEAAGLALLAGKALRERRTRERGAAEQRLEAADLAYDRAQADRDALQGSAAYESKRQLDDLADAVARLAESTRTQVGKAAAAKATAEQRSSDLAKAQQLLRDAAAGVARTETELAAAAADAGIEWAPLPEHTRGDQLVVTVRGHAEARSGDVRAVRQAVALLDRTVADRGQAQRLSEAATARHEAATADVVVAEAGVAEARAGCAQAVRQWWEQHRERYGERRSEVLAALTAALDDVGSDDAVPMPQVLAELAEPLVEELRSARQQARAAAAEAAARHAALTAERAAVAAETDDAPAGFAARTGSRAGLAGAPLWQLVRFADGVGPADAAGIEAALQAANLLDGWVCASAPADVTSDQFLVPLPVADRPSGATLSDVLEVEEQPAVPRALVADLLASIALAAPATSTGDGAPGPVWSGAANAAPALGTDGRYRQGVQLGRHSKPDAEYIGATARARRRAARLAELDAALEAAAADQERASAAESRAAAQLAGFADAARALPRTGAVSAALRAVTEAAGALRTRADAMRVAAGEFDKAVADVATAERKVRTAAAEHRAPRKPADLDALTAAIRHFENVGNTLASKRSEHSREVEREREANDRREEAIGMAEEYAEEAAIAQLNLEQQSAKLETLRESLGASAEQIDVELELARQRIEAAKAEQRAARKADREAGEHVGQADGAYHTALEGLRNAVTEAIDDAQRLAPYAARDVLALLGAPECDWPASEAAWSTVDQLMYRMVAVETPEELVAVVPPEVQALFDNLSTATQAVRTSDAARKSTRTAVTTALQEFDAQLAAAGQEFRLNWDAAEGLTIVRVHDEQGFATLADFAARIQRARRDQEQLLTEAERRILEDALLTGLAQQIHERTVDARDLIARMGAEMKQRRMSSGNTIGVHWTLADTLGPEARAVCKLLDGDAAVLSPDELATIRAHFASEIRAARAAHPERSYPEILAATLDYRRWRVFTFTLITGDGAEDRLTVARHSALSGGEQSVSLHLPLFAAAHVMLSSADPHAPRLLGLDEAFAGVDDNGRSELLGLSVQFDLDLFMTGYDLWITYAHVPGCAHYDLAHSAAEHAVSATLLVWEDGSLLAEHDGSDLAAALGSPLRRRVPRAADGALEWPGHRR